MSQIDTSKMSKGKADALEAAEAAREKGKVLGIIGLQENIRE